MKPARREPRRHKFDKSGGEGKKYHVPAPITRKGKKVHQIRRMPRH